MFDTGAVVERMIATAHQLSQYQAALLADMVAVADATPNPEFAGYEISCALTWTRRAADVQLDLAETIVRRLPAVHAAMAAGEIDLPKARVIANSVATLDLELARSIVGEILPKAAGLTTGELGPRLARLVIKADPEAAANRRRARVRQRRVELQPTEDSCANILGLDLPAEDALAASNRLAAMARAMKQAGDPRSLDQLGADTFLNLLLGNVCSCHSHSDTFGPHRDVADLIQPHASADDTQPRGAGAGTQPRGAGAGTQPRGASDGGHSQSAADSGQPVGQPGVSATSSCRCAGIGGRRAGGVELTGDLEMLARLAERPGDLGGYGAVIAEIARQVAEQQRRSPWTFTIRDRATGQIFTGPVRRRPTEAMARHIRARDRTCRAPGCRRIGIYADFDHTIACEHGGLTVPGNLGLLCRYHHRAKHEGFWLLVQVRPGVFVWRSPLGRRYIVYPAAP